VAQPQHHNCPGPVIAKNIAMWWVDTLSHIIMWLITSISRSTCGTCGNPPAVGAGDVGEEGGMVSAQLEAVKREWRAGEPVWALITSISRSTRRNLQKSACCWCRRCGRGRGNGQRTAGSHRTRVEDGGADLSTTCTISPATPCICKIPPAVGAGDVKRKMENAGRGVDSHGASTQGGEDICKNQVSKFNFAMNIAGAPILTQNSLILLLP
jgi:hypothetical protein